MAYFAQCAPERIPMTLVEGAVEDEAECMKGLAVLAEVSLVKHDPFEDSTPAVTVHRLVQAVARARSEASGSAQNAVERLIARLMAIYPQTVHDDPQSWPLCAQLIPHLLAQRDARPDDASMVTSSSRFTSFSELGATELYSARPGCGQSRLSARGDHRALFLCQRSKQMQNERVNVWAKLADQERHAVSHEAADEVNVATEAVQLGHGHGAPLAAGLTAPLQVVACGREHQRPCWFRPL
jgi:hypothetical protein